MRNLEQMIGKVFVSVTYDDDEVRFTEADGSSFRLYHYQDCCESVEITGVSGNLDNLVGSPIISATCEDGVNPEAEDYEPESSTYEVWCFKTGKGTVKVATYGTSNGYYSETYSLEYCDENGKRNYGVL